jgi:murein DD-endopeptidase MepM/ murein hydrolase activator NlpD
LDGEEVDFSTRTGDPPCPGDPVPNPEIAPQKGPSGILGGMFGNSSNGGCTRFGANHCNTPRNKKHDGIDIKNDIGMPVYTMHEGFVYSSGYSDDYGYYTTIQSNVNGETILTTYAHLKKEERIEQGPPGSALVKVSTGQILGYQGDTGNLKDALLEESVDPHIHIEIRKHDGSNSWNFDDNFNLVDPRIYLGSKINSNGITTNNCN